MSGISRNGQTDVSQLTNLVFVARHPELTGRRTPRVEGRPEDLDNSPTPDLVEWTLWVARCPFEEERAGHGARVRRRWARSGGATAGERPDERVGLRVWGDAAQLPAVRPGTWT